MYCDDILILWGPPEIALYARKLAVKVACFSPNVRPRLTALVLDSFHSVRWLLFQPISGGEGGWERRDKKSETTFFNPGRYNICTLNSEMKAKWHCWRGEMGRETRVKAVTSGLWSVQSWKDRPSQKWWKCRIAAKAANNSRSKVEWRDSMSVNLQKKRGHQWSPDFCCMTSPIWVSEASVARESSVFGAGCWRVTAAARRHFAFWNASCAEAVHSNILAPPPPQEISQRVQHLCAIEQKTVLKIHHAEKTLQLFDVLRGWVKLDDGGVTGPGGCPCRWIVWSRISKEGTAKTHFSRLMVRPLVAKALKKSSRWRRCVCLPGEPTRESSMYANTPSRPSVVQSIILWKVCAALDNPNGVNKYSNKQNGVIIAIFGMSAAAIGIW